MSFRGRNVDIKEFLANINLVQYLPYFKEAGYNALSDCIGINNNVLQQIGISPTGHRKRILKQLEITFSKMQEKSVSSENLKHKDLEELGESHSLCYAQVSKISNLSSSGVAKASLEFVALPARHFSEEKSEFTEHELLAVKDGSFSDLESSSSSYEKSDCSGDAVSLSGNIEKSTNFQNIPNMDVALEKSKAQQGNLHFDNHSALYIEDPSSQSSFADSSETKSSENEHLTFSEVEISPNVLPDSPFFEFKGEMVDNDLYGPCKQSGMKVVPRTTRSFMLRHRPVPEIPGSSKIAASPSSLQERRNVDVLNISGSPTSCTGSPTSQKKTSSEEMPSVISPYGETFLFNSLADAKEICGNEFLAFEEKFEDKEVTEEHCLHDKSCVFNIQKGKASSEDHVKNELISQEDTFMFPEQLPRETEYTTVEECSPYLRTKNHTAQKYSSFPTKNRSRNLEHSVKESVYFLPFDDKQIITPNDSITPYACFYGSSVKKVKAGWLDKLSPQGKRMFQKRWVKFDGDSISYYNNDKEVYSKGIILLSAIVTVRVHGENKFEVVTAHRNFVFRVEKEDERIDWINTMLSALKSQSNTPQTRAAVTPEKSGYLELKGYKAKIFTLLLGNNVWLCKSEQSGCFFQCPHFMLNK
nr:arf-GAP with Rho-GAP domain, ANK repeat and PH domain-containing protein 2 [Chelonoidis abingdonii]